MRSFLGHGWALAVAHPSLWLYGMLISLLGAQWLRLGGTVSLTEEQWDMLRVLLQDLEGNTLLTFASLMIVGFSFYWLVAIFGGNWALAALLDGLGREETAGPISSSSTAAAGARHFWSVLVIGLFTAEAILVLLLIEVTFGLLALFTRQSPYVVLLFAWLPVLVLLSLVALIIGAVAQVHVVLAQTGPVEAIRYAWRLLRQNPFQLLGVWCLADLAIGLTIGLISALPISLVAIPALLYYFLQSAASPLVLLWPFLLLCWAVFVGGMGEVFRRALWVAAYRRMQ